jgi:hypothetical protein
MAPLARTEWSTRIQTECVVEKCRLKWPNEVFLHCIKGTRMARTLLRTGLLLFAAGPLACAGDIGTFSDDPSRPDNRSSSSPRTGGTTTPAPGGSTATNPMTGSTTTTPSAGQCAQVLPARIRRLMLDEYHNTVKAVFPSLKSMLGDPFEGEKAEGRFGTDAEYLRLPLVYVERLVEQSEKVVTEALEDVLRQFSCLSDGDAACVKDVLGKLGGKMFRRPLNDEEVTRYSAFYLGKKAEAGGKEATSLLLQALLTSPHFMFRWETGGAADATKLTAYEIASAISYGTTSAPPDERLMGLAADGKLKDRAVIEAELKRLIPAKDYGKLLEFFRQYLHFDGLLEAEKKESLFPFFNADFAKAMVADTESYLTEHYTGKASLSQLLTSPFVLAQSKTAALYGLDKTAVGATPQKVTSVKDRFGVMTQPAVIAALSDADILNPVKIGATIRERLLCAEVPPPPPDVATNLEEAKKQPNMTLRQMFEAHRQPPCMACHTLIDPLGFAFGQYDAVGQFRPTENGKSIDTSGEVTEVGSFGGVTDLMDKLAKSDRVASCFRDNVLAYYSGVSDTTNSGCSTALGPAGQTLEETIVDVVSNYLLAERRR